MQYRLDGDRNLLHSHPEADCRAGFDRPILHRHCTFGVAACAVLKAHADCDLARLRGIEACFSAPIFPDETIAMKMWRDGTTISFHAFAA